MKFSSFFPAALAATGVAIAASSFAPANAFTFGTAPRDPAVGNPNIYSSVTTVGITTSDIGDSFTIDWLLPKADSGISQDLSATAVFTVSSFTSSFLDLTVNLTNTTVATFQAAILAMGLGVTPDATVSLLTPGAVFDSVGPGQGGQQQFPGGFKNIDLCAYAANNCSGGNINQGLQSGGNSDTFTVRLAGSFGATPSVTLSDFAIKFQTEQGSFEFPGTPDGGTDPDPDPQPVPEPATAAALGVLALGAFGALKKKNNALN
jgi:hypothetical protein